MAKHPHIYSNRCLYNLIGFSRCRLQMTNGVLFIIYENKQNFPFWCSDKKCFSFHWRNLRAERHFNGFTRISLSFASRWTPRPSRKRSLPNGGVWQFRIYAIFCCWLQNAENISYILILSMCRKQRTIRQINQKVLIKYYCSNKSQKLSCCRI